MDKTAGQKYDEGKPRMDLLDPYALEQLAMVLGFGAKKYAAHNWRKGISTSRLIAAALRHLFAYLGGQDKDPETGLSHVAHAMCCCMFLLGLNNQPKWDDRWKPDDTVTEIPLPFRGTRISAGLSDYQSETAQTPTSTASSLPFGLTQCSPESLIREPSACR